MNVKVAMLSEFEASIRKYSIFSVWAGSRSQKCLELMLELKRSEKLIPKFSVEVESDAYLHYIV